MPLSRRDMILTLGAMGGTALLPDAHASAATPDVPRRKVGWAILGLGNHASITLPSFRATRNAELVALISGSPDKLARVGAEYQVPADARYSYDDWEQIRNDERIDVVYVITPVGTHVDFALEAIKAGKHVLVEKTLAESARRARTLIAAANSAGRTLGTAYRARHDPANRQLIDIVRGGALGRLTAVNAHKGFVMQLPPDNWRFDPVLSGGGTLVDIGIYSVQACRYVTGEEPVEVQANVWSDPSDPRYRSVEQSMAMTMRFPGGTLATATASWNYTGQNNVWAAFEKGSARLDPATFGSNNRLYIGQLRDGRYTVEEPPLPTVNQLPAQIEHFSNAILTGTAPMSDGVEGLKDILVIEALYRAVASGRVEPVATV